MFWPAIIVIGRILAEPDSVAPLVDDPALLLIKRQNVMICPPTTGDAGVDAGLDGGDAGADAGIADAGVPDAGPSDAGVSDAGSDAMADASVCTTFANAVTMIVQPHVSVSADGTRFAVLLAVPDRPLFEIKAPIFEELARITAPEIVTRTVEVEDPSLGRTCHPSYGCGGGGGGCGGDFGGGDFWDPPGIDDAGLGDGGLVEEMIGPYQFVRAKPSSTTELAGWLDQLGYAYDQQDLGAVAPYIQLGYHIVAIRVSLDKPQDAPLVPIALTWSGTELRVPAALGRADGSVPTTFTVYIAAEGRYELPSATIRYAKMAGLSSMGFLTRNEIELDQSRPPEADPIAMRVEDRTYTEVIEQIEEVRVPVRVYCDSGADEHDEGCCSECNAKPRTRVDLGLIVVAVAFVLRRRRRR